MFRIAQNATLNSYCWTLVIICAPRNAGYSYLSIFLQCKTDGFTQAAVSFVDVGLQDFVPFGGIQYSYSLRHLLWIIGINCCLSEWQLW